MTEMTHRPQFQKTPPEPGTEYFPKWAEMRHKRHFGIALENGLKASGIGRTRLALRSARAGEYYGRGR